MKALFRIHARRSFSDAILPSAYASWTKKQLDATLSMPKTSFTIRCDVDRTEERFREQISSQIYDWQMDFRDSKDPIYLHDGPPFANGDLHIGHALNKILKDITARYLLVSAKNQQIHFRPGWDCHGLPIEVKAIKSIQTEDPSMVDPISIRRKCRKFAEEAASCQASQMRQWGLFLDHSRPYYTMDPQYEAEQLHVFADMVQRDLVFRAKQPVFWSPFLKSALAEAEIEYNHEFRSTAVFVRFFISLNEGRKMYLPVWTTTPWTLTANMAIAYGPNIKYCLVEDSANRDLYVVAKERLKTFNDHLQRPISIIEEDFAVPDNLTYEDLWKTGSIRRPLLSSDHVTSDSGTGLVHMAPAYGKEDFDVIFKQNQQYFNDWKLIETVNEAGKFDSSLAPDHLKSDLDGKDIFTDGSEGVIQHLRAQDSLICEPYNHKHSYPIDWRLKRPIIQRATPQWFVNLQAIRAEMLAALDSVQFIPTSSKQRFENMITSRPSWCISRQRLWGLPIPAFVREENPDQQILDPVLIRHVAEIIRERGSDCWWEKPDQYDHLIPESYQGLGLQRPKQTDTFDVWFDSGTSWRSFMGKDVSAEVCFEGSDQFRGWFQSSLIAAVSSARQTAPYKRLVAHGFVLDGQGAKMSKSLGNVVEPSSVILGDGKMRHKHRGTDLLRYWSISSDYTRDIQIGSEILENVGEALQKLRNSIRFILGNIREHQPCYRVEWISDWRIVEEMSQLYNSIIQAYDEFNFHKVYRLLNSFVGNELAVHFEAVKDRLYAGSYAEQTSARDALWLVGTDIIRLISPVLPFLAEEANDELYKTGKSVFMDCQIRDSFCSDYLQRYSEDFRRKKDTMQVLDTLQPRVKSSMSELWALGQIKNHCQVDLSISTVTNLDESSAQIAEYLGVGRCFINYATALMSDIVVEVVSPSKQFKCPRCWNPWSRLEGDLCARCISVLDGQFKLKSLTINEK